MQWELRLQFEIVLNPITAKGSTLAELLRDGVFNVPRHQRYYDWDDSHVKALLADLAEAASQGAPCHFLGSIMLIRSESEEKWEINDGQQRIITFSLICAYLCKIFHDRGMSTQENHILRVLFDLHEGHNKNLQDADDLSPRVTPPRENKTNFNLLIRGHDVGANGKMILAWDAITKFFENPQYQTLSWQKKALDFMLNSVLVVRLEVDESLDVNAIFETLNYRGKHLDQVDLIKNYFLSFFSSDLTTARGDTVYEGFERIYENFPKVVSEYARCYMQTKYGFINKEQFFRDTRNRFGHPKKGKSKKVFKLVNGLAKKENIEIFKTVRQKSASADVLHQLTIDAKKTKNRRKVDAYLLDLHDYTIARPIIFSLLCSYVYADKGQKKAKAKFVYASLKLLASFVQRITHVGNFRPSLYEGKFADLAMSISKNECTTAQQFLDNLKTYDNAEIITDARYIEQMKTRFYSQSSIKKSSYILKKIIEHEAQGTIINDDQVSVEHILPKSDEHNFKPAWAQKFNQDERDRFTHCLGNLTLLSKNDNSPKASDNESFVAKKKIYAKSSYQLTKDICVHAEWTPRIVQNRQAKLAKIAAKQIWDFRL